MRVTLISTSIKNRRNCCNQMPKKAAKPLSTGISAPRGKYFYLSVNCNFDINSCEAQFISKWGQTVDVRFVHPQKSFEDDKELQNRNRPNSFSVRSFLFSKNIYLI